MRFKLLNFGKPYLSICQGRKEVGRLWKHRETGLWHAQIETPTGRAEGTGNTRINCFEKVSASALGFDTVEELNRYNAKVLAEKRAMRGERARFERQQDDLDFQKVLNYLLTRTVK